MTHTEETLSFIETYEERVKVMKAFLSGKKIEFQYRNGNKENWKPITTPSWGWNVINYRIKDEQHELF